MAAQTIGLQLGNQMGRLWRSYERVLKKRPVLTQATTSAALWSVGDLIAQRLETIGKEKKPVDVVRAVQTGGFGAGLVGPVGHFWYLGLDKAAAAWFTPGSWRFIATKVILDSAILGPFYVAGFFAYGVYVMEGGGREQFRKKMETDFLPTLAAEMAIWPLFQTFNFTKVPLAHQLLAVNFMTLLDAAFMSWARTQDDWASQVFGPLGHGGHGAGASAVAEAVGAAGGKKDS